jgi:uncharacterized membrane protein YbhN (UPF0104 family)
VLAGLAAALVGGGVWLLIGQAASYSRLLTAVRHADPGWLAASLGGAGAAYLGYALLYQAITHVEAGPRPPFRLALRMTVVVFGSAVVATAAGRLGSEYWSLRRMREEAPHAWARVLALNTAIWGVLATLAATGALARLAGAGWRAPVWLALVWLGVVILCAAPALYLASERFHPVDHSRGGRVRRVWWAVMQSLMLLRRVFLGREEGLRGWGGGLLYWAGQLLVVWAALRAFGVHLGYGPLLLGYATGYAATILPLPAGGAGGVDAAGVYALTLVGTPLSGAVLATLVQRIFTYWLPLLVAIVSLRLIRRLGMDLGRVTRPSATR